MPRFANGRLIPLEGALDMGNDDVVRGVQLIRNCMRIPNDGAKDFACKHKEVLTSWAFPVCVKAFFGPDMAVAGTARERITFGLVFAPLAHAMAELTVEDGSWSPASAVGLWMMLRAASGYELDAFYSKLSGGSFDLDGRFPSGGSDRTAYEIVLESPALAAWLTDKVTEFVNSTPSPEDQDLLQQLYRSIQEVLTALAAANSRLEALARAAGCIGAMPQRSLSPDTLIEFVRDFLIDEQKSVSEHASTLRDRYFPILLHKFTETTKESGDSESVAGFFLRLSLRLMKDSEADPTLLGTAKAALRGAELLDPGHGHDISDVYLLEELALAKGEEEVAGLVMSNTERLGTASFADFLLRFVDITKEASKGPKNPWIGAFARLHFTLTGLVSTNRTLIPALRALALAIITLGEDEGEKILFSGLLHSLLARRGNGERALLLLAHRQLVERPGWAHWLERVLPEVDEMSDQDALELSAVARKLSTDHGDTWAKTADMLEQWHGLATTQVVVLAPPQRVEQLAAALGRKPGLKVTVDQRGHEAELKLAVVRVTSLWEMETISAFAAAVWDLPSLAQMSDGELRQLVADRARLPIVIVGERILDGFGSRDLAEAIHRRAAVPDATPGPDTQPEAMEWMRRGVSLAGQGDADSIAGVLFAFDRALDLNPALVLAHLSKANCFRSLGLPDIALTCLESALALEPNSHFALLLKANTLAMMGRFEEAVPFFDAGLALEPTIAVAWYEKGATHSALRQYEAALKAFDRVHELDPSHVAAWSDAGDIHQSLGQHDAAIRCYDRVLTIVPRDVNAWAQKGRSEAALERPREAIECFKVVVAEQPDHRRAWFSMGEAYAALGEHDEAHRCFSSLVKLAPQSAAAWASLARSQAALGRDVEALDSFARAVRLDPDDRYSWWAMGIIHASNNQHEQAVDCFDRLLAIDPANSAAWEKKGDSLRALERYEEARECFERELEMDPSNALGWVVKGNTEAQLGNDDAAIQCYDRAIALDPNLAEAWFFKGVTLFRGKEFDVKFWECLERAKQLGEPRAGPLLDQITQTMVDAERQGKLGPSKPAAGAKPSDQPSSRPAVADQWRTMVEGSPFAPFITTLASAAEARKQDVVRKYKATLQTVAFLDWLYACAIRGSEDETVRLGVMSLTAELGALLPRDEDPLWWSVSVGVSQAIGLVMGVEESKEHQYLGFLERWFLASEAERPSLISRCRDLLQDDVFPAWLRDRIGGLAELPPEHTARQLLTPKAADLASCLAVSARTNPKLAGAATAAADAVRRVAPAASDVAAKADSPPPASQPPTSRPSPRVDEPRHMAPTQQRKTDQPWWKRMLGG